MVPIGEISVKQMNNDERKHPERKQTYCCRECGYQSDRRFNVERHANRMHSKCITKKCCHILFVKKSDYYHHIEDYHPGMRASCFVSKKKYKIYGRKLKLSTGFSYKTKFGNTVNNSNISDKCTAMRRSMRIQDQVEKRGKLSLKENSTESDCNEYNEESENNDDSTNNNCCQNIIFHDIKQGKYMNNSQNNIDCTGSSLSCLEESSSENNIEEYQQALNDSKYQKLSLNAIKLKNMSQSLLVDTEINVKKNLNIASRLPLKKRILCEMNDNVDNSYIPNNKEMKIKKTSFDDKENQNPIDIFLNEYQGATIIKPILTAKQAIQMWNNITQRQRDYLRYIDFNSF